MINRKIICLLCYLLEDILEFWIWFEIHFMHILRKGQMEKTALKKRKRKRKRERESWKRNHSRKQFPTFSITPLMDFLSSRTNAIRCSLNLAQSSSSTSSNRGSLIWLGDDIPKLRGYIDRQHSNCVRSQKL